MTESRFETESIGEDRPRRVLVVGDAMVDVTVKARPSASGGSYESSIVVGPGGLGNVAVAVVSAGVGAAFSGCIGEDLFGDLYQRNLVLSGVTPLTRRVSLPTGICVNFVHPDGERTMYTMRGANTAYRSRDLETAEVSSSAMLYASAFSLEDPASSKALSSIVSRSRGVGTPVALGGGAFNIIRDHREEFLALAARSDLLILNDREASEVTSCTDPPDALRRLVEICPDVVVTMGPKGILARLKGSFISCPAPKVRAVDTTGAGDAFAGVLLAELVKGTVPRDAVKKAQLASSRVVASLGPRAGGSFNGFNDRFFLSAELIAGGRMESKEKKPSRKIILIEGITDMEGNPASPPMIKALSSRIENVMKEMGLTAEIATDVEEKAKEEEEKPRNEQRRRKRTSR